MTKSSTYILCSRLVELGLTNGLAEKLDIFFALERVSSEEYTELMGRLGARASSE